MAPEEIVDWYRKQSITWLCYECALPGILFVFIWLGAWLFLQGIDRPYLNVFSSADMALFAGLLLLGVSKEFDDQIRQRLISENRFHAHKTVTLLAAILVLVLYSMMKVAVLNHPSALNDTTADHSTMIAIACASVTLAAAAAITCSVMRYKILDGLEP